METQKTMYSIKRKHTGLVNIQYYVGQWFIDSERLWENKYSVTRYGVGVAKRSQGTDILLNKKK